MNKFEKILNNKAITKREGLEHELNTLKEQRDILEGTLLQSLHDIGFNDIDTIPPHLPDQVTEITKVLELQGDRETAEMLAAVGYAIDIEFQETSNIEKAIAEYRSDLTELVRDILSMYTPVDNQVANLVINRSIALCLEGAPYYIDAFLKAITERKELLANIEVDTQFAIDTSSGTIEPVIPDSETKK